MTGNIRPILLLMLGMAAGVFLIACADVGGLVLARATRRQQEITVRAAIGAGRWRIVRQLLVESLVLAAIGCAAGLRLATIVARLLSEVLDLTRLSAPSLDGRVLAFAALAATVAAVVFSLAPSLQFGRTDLIRGLRESSLTTSEGLRQRRLHSMLVVVQVALAMVLLSSSGLLSLSLVRLQQVNLGFQPDQVLTFPVSLPDQRYPQTRRLAFLRDLTGRFETIPRVLSAAVGAQMPLLGGVSRTALSNIAGPFPG